MNIFTKPLTDPDVVAYLKAEGKTLLEVQTTRYYIIDHPTETPVEDIVTDWFVRHRGSYHAWRDGSHVGGTADRVTSVKVITQDNRVIEVKI